MQVDIVSQESNLLSAEASFIVAPATLGEVGITPGHTPFISTLNEGQVTVTLQNGAVHEIFISGGFIEVQPHQVTILSDLAIDLEKFDADEYAKNQRIANELLSKAKSDIDVVKAESLLANAVIKVEMAHKIKDKLAKKGLS